MAGDVFAREVKLVSMRPATSQDAALPWFDHTTLSAINQCPTWGMFRYVEQRAISNPARAMALEAGIASHHVFAAVRLLDMLQSQNLDGHFEHHGIRIFGEEKFAAMCDRIDGTDVRRSRMAFCLQALYDSGFYDSPGDKRRTMANLEEACIAYIDRWPWGQEPVWIEDIADPSKLIGIEIPLEFVIEFTCTDNSVVAYRYRGRADGVHVRSGGEIVLHENKTASRLDDAWRESFTMSHQITGYIVGLSIAISEAISRARIHGMAIPLPRTYDYGGIVVETVSRESFQIAQWVRWIWDTTRVYERFKGRPDDATRFTHSCNRYFRPCSMIPYCASDDDERAVIREEMVSAEWNPLEDKSRD